MLARQEPDTGGWHMFVQVISGRVADEEAMRRQHERWQAELRPGAAGYLGVTAGVAADGQSIAVVRFDSEASARANSERPEQGAWWAEMEKCFAEAPTFEESSDVESFLAGGSDDAGFVQVMLGRIADRARLADVDRSFTELAPRYRPDIIGGFRAWTGGDRFVEVNYFTSEAEARAAESQEPPEEVAATVAQWQSLLGDVEFLDLRDPWLA